MNESFLFLLSALARIGAKSRKPHVRLLLSVSNWPNPKADKSERRGLSLTLRALFYYSRNKNNPKKKKTCVAIHLYNIIYI